MKGALLWSTGSLHILVIVWIYCVYMLFLAHTVVPDSYHFPSSVWRWTSLVEWLLLSSSGLQCCWTGQPGRWAGSLYDAAGSYTPALSPGRAGRNTVPVALSYSSRCCQTKWPDWTKNRSEHDKVEGRAITYMHMWPSQTSDASEITILWHTKRFFSFCCLSYTLAKFAIKVQSIPKIPNALKRESDMAKSSSIYSIIIENKINLHWPVRSSVH